MSLAKEGYSNAIKGTMSEKVNLREDGTIAQDGEIAYGAKRISFNSANAANSATTNHNIVRAFLDFMGSPGSDSISNKFAVTWEMEGA